MPPEPNPPPSADAATGRAAVFVYYKVASRDAAALGAAFRRLQQSSAGCEGPMTMRRIEPGRLEPEPTPPTQTWMEIWWQSGPTLSAPDTLRRRIESAAADAGLAALADGTRHYEYFEPCA